MLCAFVGAILLAEMRSGVLRHFYAERPLQAGVITGVMLSLVALFGFDAVRAKLNERRWLPLSRLALLSLAYQTTLLIDVLLWLVTARSPVNDARPDAATDKELEEARAHSKFQSPTDQDLGTVQYDDYRGMLEQLIQNERWRHFAVRQIGRWKQRNRDGIGMWAAAMLTTGEAADVLNRLAMLNEWLSGVQDPLRGKGSITSDDAASVVNEWLNWHAEAVSVREDLVRAGRQVLPPEWATFREAVAPNDQRGLQDRHQKNAGVDDVRRILAKPFKQRAPGAITASDRLN